MYKKARVFTIYTTQQQTAERLAVNGKTGECKEAFIGMKILLNWKKKLSKEFLKFFNNL